MSKSSAEEEEIEDEDKRKAHLHKIRVQAGKKAAATRKDHAKEEVCQYL
jgi:2-methylaconitate cis-trans-isomerase PrpF